MPSPSFPLQLVPAIHAYLSEQEVLLSLPLSLLPLFLLLGIWRLLFDDHPTKQPRLLPRGRRGGR